MSNYRLLPSLFAAAALSCMTLQPAMAAEKECPKGDVAKAGTFEAKITTVGFIVGTLCNASPGYRERRSPLALPLPRVAGALSSSHTGS